MRIHPVDEHLSSRCKQDTVDGTVVPTGETMVPRETAVAAVGIAAAVAAVAVADAVVAVVSLLKHPRLPCLP